MAKGRKTGGKNFAPGQSGNLAGRTPMPEELRQARKLTKPELELAIHKYMFLSMAEIKVTMNDPKTPALELIVAAIIAKGITNGDPSRLDFILNRMIGKVEDRLKHSGSIGTGLGRFVDMTPEEREAQIKALLAERKKNGA